MLFHDGPSDKGLLTQARRCVYSNDVRRALLSILLVSCAAPSFAARAKIPTISSDPYTSAIVVDAATGKVLFEENADARVYPASVIKLMDFLLILEWLEAGKAKLTDWVRVTPEAARMGGSQVYLAEGETFSLDDMLYALSIKSANDVAVALAIHFAGTPDGFVKLMNKRAAELGMTSTKFTSVHGLPPDEGREPDFSTARDIATLSLAVLKHKDALRYTSEKLRYLREGEKKFEMRSHNRLLNDFPGCDGLKTGYFRAGGFSIAATATRDGRRVVAVVMGATYRPTRDTKAKELLSHGFLNLPELPPPPPPEPAVIDPQAAPEKSGGFLAGVKKVFIFIGKCLLVLLLLVIVGGVIAIISYRRRQRGNDWKYEP